jgi:hypothetical protein
MPRFIPLSRALALLDLRSWGHTVSSAYWVGFAWHVTVQSKQWFDTKDPEDRLAGGSYLVLPDKRVSGISSHQAWSISVVEWANEHGFEREVEDWVRETAQFERERPSSQERPDVLRDLVRHPAFSDAPKPVLAVGWELVGQPAASSREDVRSYDALAQLFVESKARELTAEPVFCRQCRFSRGPVRVEHRLGSIPADQLLVVPSGERSFVVPGMVLHFIDAHGYRPPAAFVEAVNQFVGMSMVQRVLALREALNRSAQK